MIPQIENLILMLSKVKFVDADGGPFMSKNWANGEIEIEDISFDDKKLIFKLKEV